MVWCDASAVEGNLGFGLGRLAAHLIDEQMPDIRGDFPDYRNWTCEQFKLDNILLVKFECKSGGIPCVGSSIPVQVANEILATIGPARKYHELRCISAVERYFSRDKCLFVVDLTNGGFDWNIAGEFVVDWINHAAVDHAIDLNQKRISRAIPTPPQYSQQLILQALWVLECRGEYISRFGILAERRWASYV